jgi:hypothetical protein
MKQKKQTILAFHKMKDYRCEMMLYQSSPLFTAEAQLDNKYYTENIYRFMHYTVCSLVYKKELLIYIFLYAFTIARYKRLEDEEEYIPRRDILNADRWPRDAVK